MEDLTGKIFSKLTVIDFSHKDKNLKTYWECQCKCGNIKVIASESLKRFSTKSCGKCIKIIDEDYLSMKSNELRFKSIIDDKKCWNFSGANRGQYKQIGWLGKGSILAHRASYLCFNGEITNGLYICHKCDNKKCVNPKHLYAGTAKDNARDAIKRGLHPIGPNKSKGSIGEKNCKSKLKESDIIMIRKMITLKEATYKKIALKYQVNLSTIKNIIYKKTWAHIL